MTSAEREEVISMVRSAYNEGFGAGMDEYTKYNGGKCWEDSRSRKKLKLWEERKTHDVQTI